MKTVLSALAVMAITTNAGLAEFVDLDQDEDGVVSYIEMQVGYPTLTQQGFNVVDTNGNGSIDAEEMTAAVEGGIIPKV